MVQFSNKGREGEEQKQKAGGWTFEVVVGRLGMLCMLFFSLIVAAVGN